jgi:hypothetical protein
MRIYDRENLLANVEGGVIDSRVFMKSYRLSRQWYLVGRDDDARIRNHGKLVKDVVRECVRAAAESRYPARIVGA